MGLNMTEWTHTDKIIDCQLNAWRYRADIIYPFNSITLELTWPGCVWDILNNTILEVTSGQLYHRIFLLNNIYEINFAEVFVIGKSAILYIYLTHRNSTISPSQHYDFYLIFASLVWIGSSERRSYSLLNSATVIPDNDFDPSAFGPRTVWNVIFFYCCHVFTNE